MSGASMSMKRNASGGLSRERGQLEGNNEAGDLSHGDVENATLACHLNNVWSMFLFSKQQTADSVMMLL